MDYFSAGTLFCGLLGHDDFRPKFLLPLEICREQAGDIHNNQFLYNLSLSLQYSLNTVK